MKIFALHIYFDKKPTIYEDGRQIRDYINYRDVVDANIMALEDDRANYQCFNVGGGKDYAVMDFYERVQKVTGKRIKPVISKYYRFGDTRHIFSDISRLKSLGWRPVISIEKSIDEYWEHLNSQTDIRNILDYAEKTMMSKGVVRSIQK